MHTNFYIGVHPIHYPKSVHQYKGQDQGIRERYGGVKLICPHFPPVS